MDEVDAWQQLKELSDKTPSRANCVPGTAIADLQARDRNAVDGVVNCQVGACCRREDARGRAIAETLRSQSALQPASAQFRKIRADNQEEARRSVTGI